MLTSQPHTTVSFTLYFCFEMVSESAGKEEGKIVSKKRLMKVIQIYCPCCFLNLNRSRSQNRCFLLIPFILRLCPSKMTKIKEQLGLQQKSSTATDRHHVSFQAIQSCLLRHNLPRNLASKLCCIRDSRRENRLKQRWSSVFRNVSFLTLSLIFELLI